MPKIDISKIEPVIGSAYPGPLASEMDGRSQFKLGAAAGLTQFGANLVLLAPGAKSSLRHWHENQDEFLVVTEGTMVLIDDNGETPLSPGDCCAFPAGDENGHHLVNKSELDAKFVVIGTHTATETAWYSDLDMRVEVQNKDFDFTRKDGTPL